MSNYHTNNSGGAAPAFVVRPGGDPHPEHSGVKKYRTEHGHRARYQPGIGDNSNRNFAGSDLWGDWREVTVKALEENEVSFTSPNNGAVGESVFEEERVSKVPKINKDGAPRKPRQPRPKLLKWTDNDWKNVALGLVWACGENGIQIPFGQAAQVVGERCTAGALQQALLKLRGKQIEEGNQIPSLKMAWTRKSKDSVSSLSDANATKYQVEQKYEMAKRTSMSDKGIQTLLVTLRRAYQETDRMHLAYPHELFARPVSKKRTHSDDIGDIDDGEDNKRVRTADVDFDMLPQHGRSIDPVSDADDNIWYVAPITPPIYGAAHGTIADFGGETTDLTTFDHSNSLFEMSDFGTWVVNDFEGEDFFH